MIEKLNYLELKISRRIMQKNDLVIVSKLVRIHHLDFKRATVMDLFFNKIGASTKIKEEVSG